MPRSLQTPLGGHRARSAVPLLPSLLAALVLGGWAATDPIADLALADERAAVVRAADSTGRVVVALTGERDAAGRQDAGGTAGDSRVDAELVVAQEQVDAELATAVTDLVGSNGPAARHLQQRLGQAAVTLPRIRGQQAARADESGYSDLAATLQAAVVAAAAMLPPSDAGNAVERSGLLISTIDAAAAERDLGLVILAGDAPPEAAARRELLVTDQLAALSQWAQLGGAGPDPITTSQDETGRWTLLAAREALATADPAARGLTAEAWSEVAAAHLATLQGARSADIDTAATAVAGERRTAVVVLGAMAALLLSSAVGGIVLSRRSERRADSAPTPGATADADRAETTPAPPDGEDRAETTPASPAADSLVHIARRNQALLGRQLSLIDALERHEEDPDTLASLYRLDHLATRMRRNAESLLVLAGADAGRRLREPMPLADVIRAASGEIEQYERVDVMQHTDPLVLAHAALPAAHLLAEILENATQFSPPGSRVRVTADATPAGVRIDVIDTGLGMTPAEIAVAESILDAPDGGTGQVRLGFHVVGRLAHRLGATVSIHPASSDPAPLAAGVTGAAGPRQGLTVHVDLPAAVLVGGTSPLASATGPRAVPTSPAPPPLVPVMATDQPTDQEPAVSLPRQSSAPDLVRPVTLPPAGLIPPPAPSLADAETAGAMLPRRRARRAHVVAADDLGEPSIDRQVTPAVPTVEASLVETPMVETPTVEASLVERFLVETPAAVTDGVKTHAPFAVTPPPDQPAAMSHPGDVASLRRRAVLASEALSELSMLSSYRPDVAPPATAPELVRRSRAEVPPPVPPPTTGPPRDRGPTGVRTLLSGFTSGVGRARAVPAGRDEGRPAIEPTAPAAPPRRDERSTT